MAIEQTLSIIKPDAVAKGHVDEICKRLEDAGLNIIDKKSLHLDQEKAEGFYICLLYTSPSPRDLSTSRMPSSA